MGGFSGRWFEETLGIKRKEQRRAVQRAVFWKMKKTVHRTCRKMFLCGDGEQGDGNQGHLHVLMESLMLDRRDPYPVSVFQY